MSDSKNEKAVNYTAEMIAAIAEEAPLNLEKAKALSEKLDRSWRSIVAKAKSEGFEYVSMPAPLKKPKGETKADIVSDISGLLEGVKLDGLEKAPAAALRTLREFIPAFEVEEDASES